MRVNNSVINRHSSCCTSELEELAAVKTSSLLHLQALLFFHFMLPSLFFSPPFIKAEHRCGKTCPIFSCLDSENAKKIPFTRIQVDFFQSSFDDYREKPKAEVIKGNLYAFYGARPQRLFLSWKHSGKSQIDLLFLHIRISMHFFRYF